MNSLTEKHKTFRISTFNSALISIIRIGTYLSSMPIQTNVFFNITFYTTTGGGVLLIYILHAFRIPSMEYEKLLLNNTC